MLVLFAQRGRRLLAGNADADVRLVAHPELDESARAAILALREQAVAATLDRMYGSPVEDPLANRLVGVLVAGRSWRSRIQPARALALSPYCARITDVLVSLTAAPTVEVRRAAAQALQSFPTSADVATGPTALALGDADPGVRGRALWSLIYHHTAIDQQVVDTALQERDPTVRRCAVDRAASGGYATALPAASTDPDPEVADDARLLRTRRLPGSLS